MPYVSSKKQSNIYKIRMVYPNQYAFPMSLEFLFSDAEINLKC